MAERGGPTIRDRVIDAALNLFALRGFEATTVVDIADYAETTSEVVTGFFAGKDEILREVLSPTLRRIDRILDRHDAPGAAVDLAALVEGLIHAIADAGPRVAALLDDPTVGEQVYVDAHDSALPARIEHTLTRQLARSTRSATVPTTVSRTAHRMRAACAVAAIPTAIAVWAETNPATPIIDGEARETIIDIVTAIVASAAPSPAVP